MSSVWAFDVLMCVGTRRARAITRLLLLGHAIAMSERRPRVIVFEGVYDVATALSLPSAAIEP